jgi:hypothetical protein
MKFIDFLLGRGSKTPAPPAPGPGAPRADAAPTNATPPAAPAPTGRPTLTAEQIAFMTSRFDPAKWDATADADEAAERAATQRQAARA